jgi:hypothetical protein
MPQIRVSVTPLYLSASADPREIRAAVSAAIFQIKEADIALFEWIEFVTLADIPFIRDAAIIELQKVLADAVALSEFVELAISLNPADSGAFTDDETKAIGKVLSETASLAEAATLALSKPLADNATVTDLAALEVGKPFADASSFTDALVNHFTKVAFSGYAIDYFLEDYTEGTDYIYLSEAQSFAIAKVLADTIGATDDLNGVLADDDQIIGFFKSTGNVANISDQAALSVGTPAADSFAISDARSFALDRPLSDANTFSDATVFAVGLVASDAASVSESAALQFSRPVSDDFAITDANVLAFGLGPSDAATFTDSGELLNQDYTEAFYFAEDYVGTSRTF